MGRARKKKINIEELGGPTRRTVLSEQSLPALRALARRAGIIGVTKYNDKEELMHVLYLRVNAVKAGLTEPDNRRPRLCRVTDAERDFEEIAEIYGYNQTAEILDLKTVIGVFHRAATDGFICRSGYIPSSEDVFVVEPLVRKYDLRDGDLVSGLYLYYAARDQYVLGDVNAVNGVAAEHYKAPPPYESVPPAVDVRVWGNEFINALAVLAPFKLGESVLVRCPPRFEAGGLIDDLTNAALTADPDAERIYLDLAPEKNRVRPEAVRLGLDLPADYFGEAVRVAVHRAQTLTALGTSVVLAVRNLSLVTLGDDAAAAFELIAAATNTEKASLTVICSLSPEVTGASATAAAELAADCLLCVDAAPDGTFSPCLGRTGRRENEPELAADFRRYAREKGETAAAALLKSRCLQEVADRIRADGADGE